MVLEARLGESLGITRAGTSDTLERLVKLLDLPTRLPSTLDPEVVLAFTRSDKKGRGGRPHYVLLSQPGQVAQGVDWAQEVSDRAVLSVLEDARP